ncbi:hypothetical protein LCGC14_2317150 [marine sediment metagenome]|uniref:Uncharacterized protein n=2 Tax=marine sediment metagenome TaxID=412755 RepID=A0A0F9CJ34_9ZZZZ
MALKEMMMAQGEFTKEESKETMNAVEEMWKALSKPKREEFFGHLNDIMLFLSAAEKNAPAEK